MLLQKKIDHKCTKIIIIYLHICDVICLEASSLIPKKNCFFFFRKKNVWCYQFSVQREREASCAYLLKFFVSIYFVVVGSLFSLWIVWFFLVFISMPFELACAEAIVAVVIAIYPFYFTTKINKIACKRLQGFHSLFLSLSLPF